VLNANNKELNANNKKSNANNKVSNANNKVSIANNKTPYFSKILQNPYQRTNIHYIITKNSLQMYINYINYKITYPILPN
jgi:hypothetical protein